MKKRRGTAGTAGVASGSREKTKKLQEKSEPAVVAAKNREAAAADAPAGKVWKWARRVVLGYDRNP